jgi:hypothetical protein
MRICNNNIKGNHREELAQNGDINMFHEVLGHSNIDENKTKINHREAVRAIIIEDNQILLVHSNLGDYKFLVVASNIMKVMLKV